jgi:DNA recombination protein RmuC
VPINPNEMLLWSLIALAAFVTGALLAWLLGRTRARAADRDLQRLQGELGTTAHELGEQRERVVVLTNERAVLAGRMERLAQIEQELTEKRAEALRLIEARQRAEQQATEFATRLHEQKQAAQERISLFEQTLNDKFKALSADLLEGQSKKFTEQNQTNLGILLNPLRDQLDGFRKRVDEVYDQENRERAGLRFEIDALKNLNQRISEDAINLTRALTGDAQTQGAWGEMALERLLEISGLQKGRHYDVQVVLADAAGGRPRPDVIVRLPEGRDIIVDAKVSLTAWERYCGAVDAGERDAQLAAHLVSLRRHVKELADKRYADLPGVNSLEFVLMFVPVEAAYIEAARRDDSLHAFALEKQVVIVTTSTLLATLRTVSSLWKFDDRNRNATDIAERAGKLYDKFVGFISNIEDVAGKLDTARNALGDARSKLVDGRGNLVWQVEELRKLGAKASKALPEAMIERAQTEEQQRLDAPGSKTGKPGGSD